MANRPFKVGDMAISKTFGICFVCEESERQIRIMPSNGIARLYGKDGKWRHNEIEPDIVTIRTPRKGSKEARDIVAMMLWTHRRQVQFYIFIACGFERPVDNEVIKQRYKEWKDTKLYSCIEKAKSMLK